MKQKNTFPVLEFLFLSLKAKTEEENLSKDPYDHDEANPVKSNALKSCLWELNTLKSHYSSGILKAVASFKKDFPITTCDIPSDVEFEEIFHSKMKENMEEKLPPLNFVKEEELFTGLTECGSWSELLMFYIMKPFSLFEGTINVSCDFEDVRKLWIEKKDISL